MCHEAITAAASVKRTLSCHKSYLRGTCCPWNFHNNVSLSANRIMVYVCHRHLSRDTSLCVSLLHARRDVAVEVPVEFFNHKKNGRTHS